MNSIDEEKSLPEGFVKDDQSVTFQRHETIEEAFRRHGKIEEELGSEKFSKDSN